MRQVRVVRDTDRDPAGAGPSPPPLLGPARRPRIAATVAKRAFDLVTATVALILLSPLFLLTFVALKLESRQAAFVRETRVGHNNDRVRSLKFRTRAPTQWDAKQTVVGSVLRRTNLDELPQLLSVIRGDMSMVGPRPWQIPGGSEIAPVMLQGDRWGLKPGMISWAQVNGYDGDVTSSEVQTKRVEYDLYYLENWSFLFDLKILFLASVLRQSY